MSQQDSSFSSIKVELPMEENEVFVRKEDEVVVQTANEQQTSSTAKEEPHLIPEPSAEAEKVDKGDEVKEPSLVTPTQTQVKFNFQTPDTSVKQNEEKASDNPSTKETSSKTRPRKYSVNHEETIDEVENLQKKSDNNNTLYADEFIAEVDRHYLNVAFYAVIIYLSLICVSFMVGKKYDALRTLDGMEKRAPMLASLLLGMSLISCILPLFVRGNKRCLSGVIVCAVLVQSLALITDIMLAHLPTPVFTDKITGAQVYLLRYCEWTPLAFVMAFLTESCRIDNKSDVTPGDAGKLALLMGTIASKPTAQMDDVFPDTIPSSENDPGEKVKFIDKSYMMNVMKTSLKDKVNKRLRSAYFLAVTQGASTFCGWLFPFCPNIFVWLFTLTISCSLFSCLWKRLFVRMKEFEKMKMGSTVSEQEMYVWSKLSLGLLKTCSYVWSILVFVFFVTNFGPVLLPNAEILKSHGVSMLLESTLDVVFKAIYLLIVIDVHDTIFDSSARAERRLEELRQMLSVVWDNSSDVIGISVRGVSGDVTTMLSPTLMKLYSKGENDDENFIESSKKQGSALAFELDARYFAGEVDDEIVPSNVYDLHFRDKMPFQSRPYSSKKSEKLETQEVGSIARLVIRAWGTTVPMLMHDLVGKTGSVQSIMRCEANVSRIEENALVIVVRDISERFRRFDAEKKVISETTARLKDAAANRFTRHEVKNGLLAAIGLCDSLNEGVELFEAKLKRLNSQSSGTQLLLNGVELHQDTPRLKKEDTSANTSERDELESIQSLESPEDASIKRYLLELDKTLHEILDTVLAEAMARDVIHEVYELKLGRVKLAKLLAENMNINASKSSTRRFPILTEPKELPEFATDPQLIKCIHRNAVSNACKYGKKGGKVTTYLKYCKDKGELQMQIINLPGKKHDEILKLGKLARELVFSPRRRLTMHCTEDNNNQVSASHSSGDGAWIIHKCAKTLGGNCGIEFEKDRTVFTLTCPMKQFDENVANTDISFRNFTLPTNIHALAIDDSKIQRKLLGRLLMFAGIPNDRVHLIGETADEITGFCDWAVDFIEEHPDDYILMLVDENLDVQDEQIDTNQTTISGSASVAEIRKRLLQDQERKLLALIRSANDSANDVAIYNARAHGYLAKAPVKKDQVLEILAPLWLARFPKLLTNHDIAERRASDTRSNMQVDEVLVSIDDLMGVMDELDQLSELEIDDLQEKWGIIWEKLHALKGDLLIMPNKSPSVEKAISSINSLRGPAPPEDFQTIWQRIRQSIINGF